MNSKNIVINDFLVSENISFIGRRAANYKTKSIEIYCENADIFMKEEATGVSDIFLEISENINSFLDHIKTLITLNREENILQQIQIIINENSEKGWDGYDACPISIKSAQNTYEFLNCLPYSLPFPELLPEPSGEIGMLWEINGNKLAISIDKNNEISFAGIHSDGTEIYGKVPFNRRLPKEIYMQIEKF